MGEPAEGTIFKAIERSDVAALKTLLVDKQDVNILDENLMTPLQHAAYKGNKEMVQMFLDQGADVNLCKHEHKYTSLHFAGLSGSEEVCALLLLAGADSSVTNTVGRTASQMAAFVGNHNCVALINNFVPKSDLEVYTRVDDRVAGLSPTLPPFLLDNFHKLIVSVSVHPVRIALNIQKFTGLLVHLTEVERVLIQMSAREVNRANEPHAFKYYYLSALVAEIVKLQRLVSEEKKGDVVEQFVRRLLKVNKEGDQEYLEGLLREIVRNFPQREWVLFRQMVGSLVAPSSQPAVKVIGSVLNGQRGFDDAVVVCSTCGCEKPTKKCSKCKVVWYCDRECQRLHWPVHKKVCDREVSVTSADAKPDADSIAEDMKGFLLN